jgi:hypothetical protein
MLSKGYREKFKEGQAVRIAKRDNIKEEAKNKKGRFIEKGEVIVSCGGDSYLIRKRDGKMMKKRHYDLKGCDV